MANNNNNTMDWTAVASAAAGILGQVGSWIGNAQMSKKQMRYARKLANEGMTNDQLQAFELSREAAQEEREWNLQMDSTKYQRNVADMQAAGVNPALAMNGGISTQATSNNAPSADANGPQSPLGVAPLDLSSVVEMATLPTALKKMQAEARGAEAEAKGKEIENSGKTIELQYKEENIIANLDLIASEVNKNSQVAKVSEKQAEYLQKQVDRYDEITDTEISKMWSEIGLNDAQAEVARETYKKIQMECDWMPKVYASQVAANYAAANRSDKEAQFMRFDRMKQVTLKQARSMGVNFAGFGINGSTSDDTLVLVCPTEDGKSWDMIGFGAQDVKSRNTKPTPSSDDIADMINGD